MAKKKTHTEAVSLERTCGKCAHFNPVFSSCYRSGQQTKDYIYACDRFQTLEELKAEREAMKKARMARVEQRLNFILTALYIQTTAAMQMLEYFDAQFLDRKVESDWRFKRKQAANEISRAVQRIRDIYQHSFMTDQNKIMTKHGTQPYDVEAWDCHENDARLWNKIMLHHLDASWQDEEQEGRILKFYEDLPHQGFFDKKDFRHFTTKL